MYIYIYIVMVNKESFLSSLMKAFLNECLTPSTLSKFAPWVSHSWIFCQTKPGCRNGVWQKIQEPLTSTRVVCTLFKQDGRLWTIYEHIYLIVLTWPPKSPSELRGSYFLFLVWGNSLCYTIVLVLLIFDLLMQLEMWAVNENSVEYSWLSNLMSYCHRQPQQTWWTSCYKLTTH